eukprot:Seg7591.1 transcript_id=Seg7591.1/GoldUCD/mRNA.D3Y31 product="Chromatin complexes subunit BAP18" protein_id=Seg7591.1/GoldUCD/D3Y31
MTSATKVAEIFETAGLAFSRLGGMAVELQTLSGEGASGEEGKWGEAEIEMLRQAILRFGNDLEKISGQIKTKSVGQIRSALKQKAMQQKVNVSKATNIGLTADELERLGVIADTTQTTQSVRYGDQGGATPAKKIRLDDSGSVVVSSQDNLLLGNPALVNNTTLIESALDKLKYESKDTHAEIDIEG